MRVRFLSVVLLAGLLSMVTVGPASAQALPLRSLRSISPEHSDFTLTNQPLFTLPEPQTAAPRTSSSDPEFGFGFGIKGGPLFSSFTLKDASTSPFENRNGWLVGIFFGGNRPGVVGVQGEVMYGKKGVPNPGGTGNVDLYFIEIPVLLRVNVGTQSINKWVVYGIVGPAFDIKLKGRQGDLDVAANYEGLNIGIMGGAGFEIFRFLVEGRGNWGVRNVIAGDLAPRFEIRDRSFALLFGVRFN